LKQRSLHLLYLALFLPVLSAFATAAPTFAGLRSAEAAPGAAVLRWDRAKSASKEVTYRVYRKGPSGWSFDNPIASVKGNEWVVLNLVPGQPSEFLVRASDATGTDANTKSLTVTPSARQPAEEWRGVWFTRFEWAGGSRAAVQKRMSTALDALSDGHFNAIVLQVRGQGDTLYSSKDEPWSPLVSNETRESDPLGFTIAEAKKHNLQVHAWMNLSVIWQDAAGKLPANKRHPFYRFADAKNANARAGLIHDANGKPEQFGADAYVWLTHGNPEVNAYLRKQVVDFLDRYAVDGLHWDDRTGNPNGVSRDPVSVRRFSARGNPMQIKDFGEWQREQLTRFLSDVYVTIKAKHPRLLVSASPFGIADRNRIAGYQRFSDAEKFGVQPERWLALGVIDVLMPQVYWDLPDPEPNFGTVVRDWAAHNKSGRPIWPGSALGKYGDVQPLSTRQAQYVALTRALGLGGNNYFSFGAAKADEWRAVSKQMYPTRATVPVPAHLRKPAGQAMGYVRDGSGKPIVDCWVGITGRQYIYLSSADGFYGIPNLPPGDYTLTFGKAAGQRATKSFQVESGKTARIDMTLP
jgi:uncharacterized lipoprotein YddW (UPF0748 family)